MGFDLLKNNIQFSVFENLCDKKLLRNIKYLVRNYSFFDKIEKFHKDLTDIEKLSLKLPLKPDENILFKIPKTFNIKTFSIISCDNIYRKSLSTLNPFLISPIKEFKDIVILDLNCQISTSEYDSFFIILSSFKQLKTLGLDGIFSSTPSEKAFIQLKEIINQNKLSLNTLKLVFWNISNNALTNIVDSVMLPICLLNLKLYLNVSNNNYGEISFNNLSLNLKSLHLRIPRKVNFSFLASFHQLNTLILENCYNGKSDILENNVFADLKLEIITVLNLTFDSTLKKYMENLNNGFAKLVSLRNLSLNLDHVDIKDEGFKTFSECFLNKNELRILKLYLQFNHIKSSGVIVFTEVISKLENLFELYLDFTSNCVNDKGVSVLDLAISKMNLIKSDMIFKLNYVTPSFIKSMTKRNFQFK